MATAIYSALVAGGGGYGSLGQVTTSGHAYVSLSGLLTVLDSAINKVSQRRALVGAFQNRLDAATQAIGIRVQNYSASESAIRNVDVATESSNMTRYQILQQAGVSVLSQANSSSQLALQLLRG